ncbi:unnamed protein product [Nesidiocoris tenuis]|uniref:Uncharacterized protein n=1 Tax=Nesidiocoris tenuis TaxID=355587 RepID=A0A6H5FYV0_9HEMI|nr:unnamed protein product [Nesidiocoris tenuis]
MCASVFGISEELCKFCTGVHFSIAKTNLTIYLAQVHLQFPRHDSLPHSPQRTHRWWKVADRVDDEKCFAGVGSSTSVSPLARPPSCFIIPTWKAQFLPPRASPNQVPEQNTIGRRSPNANQRHPIRFNNNNKYLLFETIFVMLFVPWVYTPQEYSSLRTFYQLPLSRVIKNILNGQFNKIKRCSELKRLVYLSSKVDNVAFFAGEAYVRSALRWDQEARCAWAKFRPVLWVATQEG